MKALLLLALLSTAAAASTPNFVIFHADDLGYGDLHANHPERVKAMQTAFEKLIRADRSTPGPAQKNDQRVVRYPKSATPKNSSTDQ